MIIRIKRKGGKKSNMGPKKSSFSGEKSKIAATSIESCWLSDLHYNAVASA